MHIRDVGRPRAGGRTPSTCQAGTRAGALRMPCLTLASAIILRRERLAPGTSCHVHGLCHTVRTVVRSCLLVQVAHGPSSDTVKGCDCVMRRACPPALVGTSRGMSNMSLCTAAVCGGSCSCFSMCMSHICFTSTSLEPFVPRKLVRAGVQSMYYVDAVEVFSGSCRVMQEPTLSSCGAAGQA